MKGAVDLITLIIVACMVVSIGLMLWFYLSTYYSQVTRSGENSTAKSLETLSSCMRIEEAYQNNFFIRNCGTGLITNDTLNVYIDDNRFSFGLNPASINSGKTGTLSLQGAWGLSIGQHTLRVTNPNVETSALFESDLPSSCILALDFDESSGNIAHDSSNSGNNGILGDGTCNSGSGSCPNRISGKFGNALQFDGLNDLTNISNPISLNGLNNSFTVEAWINPYTASHTGYNRIIWFNGNKIDFAFTNQVNGVATIWLNFNDSTNSNWLNGGTPLVIGQWYNVMATFSASSGNVNIYVNGKNDGLFNVGQKNIATLSANIIIGNINDLSRSFNGTIDSVRIFNDTLTPNQTLNFRLI